MALHSGAGPDSMNAFHLEGKRQLAKSCTRSVLAVLCHAQGAR